ncbi:MAG: ATP-binding cassette domain-containing protein [Rhodospirillales bacterium]|nr:ATP-binding cassette domain-containing protein [Rhodospirillales bacterium]
MFGRKKQHVNDEDWQPGKLAYMPGAKFDLALASLFINVLSLAMPLTLLQVYDRIIPNSAEGTLILLIVGIGVALVLEAMLRLGRSYVTGWMSARFDHLAGSAAIERFLGASIIDFEKQGAGAHLEGYNALAMLRDYYSGQALLAFWDLPFAILYLGAIAYLAGLLFLVPVVIFIAFFIVAYVIGEKLRAALNIRMSADDRRFSFLIEVLGGVHTVKGLAMEEQMVRRYERLQETCAEAEHDVALRSSYAQSAGAFFSQVILFSVVGVGSTYVIDGALTVGGLAACTMLAGRSMQPLQKAVGIWTRFQSIKLAEQRLKGVFAMQVEKAPGLPELPPVKGAITLENVTFSFGKNRDGEELPPLFENVSLHINPGEIVGISGGNASGKSSLLYLMMGVFAPTSGTARIDGNDLRDYQASSIRKQAVYLPQEGVLFNGTLLENLTMFRDDKIQDAMDMSKLLGLDSVVAQMPQGYESPVGDGAGDKMPRGIKQRVAIARALVDKPRILLFDEANAAMDGTGDAMLRGLLERLRGRVTLVLVTPRPSMLNLADRIYDIVDANLVERGGSADQLSSKSGQVVPA